MSKKKKLQLLSLILPLLFSLIFLTKLYAQTKTVSISVKLSVCGDGIVEGREDCEGEELNDATCESLGFKEGTLTCDPSCSFNTFLCIPFPEPEPIPEPIQDDAPEEQEEEIELVYETEELKDLENEQFLSKNQYLEIFDSNNDGILTTDEIPTIVVTWVNAWTISRESSVCDLNDDRKCDIYDFSILLYHIDNKDI